MTKMVLGLAAAFIVTLAVIVGKQMSADAMAVVVGVVCGIGASIPTSLLMIYVIDQQAKREETHVREFKVLSPPQPNIVVVMPPEASHPQMDYVPRQSLPKPAQIIEWPRQ